MLCLVQYSATAGTSLNTWTTGTTGANTSASGVAVDALDNVYIAGVTTGGLDGTVTGNYDLFLKKYDSSGSVQWTRQLGAAGATVSARSVAVDSLGNIYITGSTTGFRLDGSSLTGTYDYFVTKYDSTGNNIKTVPGGRGRSSDRGLQRQG